MVRHYVDVAVGRYCASAADKVWTLPIVDPPSFEDERLPPAVMYVPLPEWADDLGVGGKLLVPSHVVVPGDGPSWRRTGWFAAVAWYLHGIAERAHESRHGPVHSFAFRLRGWPEQIWERAWANRIALFLRRWAAREQNRDESRLFGPLPEADIVLTHDVDYVSKTLDFRLKQAVHLVRGLVRGGASGAAARRIFLSGDYFTFPVLMALEEKFGVRSIVHFYGGPAGRRRAPSEVFLDPGYDVGAPRIAGAIARLRDGGWKIGLHQGFNSWRSSDRMAEEKWRVEQASNGPVAHCRQHWLRFSWRETWRAQQAAGLKSDATLGFNDRAGFRNGGALAMRPWDSGTECPIAITVMPLVVMDSQIRNFPTGSDDDRVAEIAKWLDEVKAVRGEATVVWHPHTLHADFSGHPGYEDLLRLVA